MFAFMQPGDVVSVLDCVAQHLRLASLEPHDPDPDTERDSQDAS